MRDFRTELTAGRCVENHGCNVAKTCMCDLAEAMLEEIERLQAALQELDRWERLPPLPDDGTEKGAAT